MSIKLIAVFLLHGTALIFSLQRQKYTIESNNRPYKHIKLMKLSYVKIVINTALLKECDSETSDYASDLKFLKSQ